MRSSELFRAWSPDDLPTTEEDLRALRRHRPQAGGDCLAELTRLSAQVPGAAASLRKRRTFAGLEPFEI
jgi:hypothetical protein